MEVSASRLAQLGYVTKFSCGDRFSLQLAGVALLNHQSQSTNKKIMKDKEEILIVVTIVVAITALAILGHMTGVREATMKMEKQAIAHGVGTYNEEGEFKWIKK